MKTELILGDAFEHLPKLPEKSVDLIFADPPYNLSGPGHLTCRSGKLVACDKGDWDQIEDLHEFNSLWISECIRVLKDTGTLWISGTLHSHPSVGVALKKLGLWIINDLIWYKPNAAPLIQKNRFAPSTELIWVAGKSKKYYFDYETAKHINGGKQMRNLWIIPAERHLTPHPTEKPEGLLARIIQIGSQPGDVVLDPFMGSGTTGAVAKRYHRHFMGIEVDETYFEIAKNRIEAAQAGIELPLSSKDSQNGTPPSQPKLYNEKAEVGE
jgi:site-specific DNA-methyltransferase (adenine-specific)